MEVIYEAFLDYGGVWLAFILVLFKIAFSKSAQDARRKEVPSTKWLMGSAIGVALLSWLWSFGRLFGGYAYLRGSGRYPELSTTLLVLILAAAGLAWRGMTWRRFHPWLTHALVVVLVVSHGGLLLEAPDTLSRGSKERGAILFVQRRLASLGCFEATRDVMGGIERIDGEFDTLTNIAVISFQMANGLVDTTPASRGTIRREKEFRLLARPFPFLFHPKPCPKPSESVHLGD